MLIWRRFILGIVMLWLPLQGFAAVAMPFCAHASGDSSMHAQHGGHQHHNHNGGTPDPVHHDDGSPIGLSCSDCGACHLACAPIVPCSAVEIGALGGFAFGIVPPASLSLFIPSLPTPPPLATIV